MSNSIVEQEGINYLTDRLHEAEDEIAELSHVVEQLELRMDAFHRAITGLGFLEEGDEDE